MATGRSHSIGCDGGILMAGARFINRDFISCFCNKNPGDL